MFATATKTVGCHPLESVGRVFARIAAAYAGAQAANRVFAQFSRLSDRQLADRGLIRDDVIRLTLQALTRNLDA